MQINVFPLIKNCNNDESLTDETLTDESRCNRNEYFGDVYKQTQVKIQRWFHKNAINNTNLDSWWLPLDD